MSNFRGISMGNSIEVFSSIYADNTVLLGDTVRAPKENQSSAWYAEVVIRM